MSQQPDTDRIATIIAGVERDSAVAAAAVKLVAAFFNRYGNEPVRNWAEFRAALDPLPMNSGAPRRALSNKRREVERAIVVGQRVAGSLRYAMGEIERLYRAEIISATYDSEDGKGKPCKKLLYSNDQQRADELVSRCAGDSVYAALEMAVEMTEGVIEDAKVFEAWLRREYRAVEIEFERENLGRRDHQ